MPGMLATTSRSARLQTVADARLFIPYVVNTARSCAAHHRLVNINENTSTVSPDAKRRTPEVVGFPQLRSWRVFDAVQQTDDGTSRNKRSGRDPRGAKRPAEAVRIVSACRSLLIPRLAPDRPANPACRRPSGRRTNAPNNATRRQSGINGRRPCGQSTD